VTVHKARSEDWRGELTSAAFNILKRMARDGCTIRASRVFPFPHKYIVKNPAKETGNIETNANVVSDLVEARCIKVLSHDADFDHIEYGITENGERVVRMGGEL
jgi:hypothetical protein